MANNIVSHDGPRSVATADGGVVDGVMDIEMIYWLNPSNIGDTAVIQDDKDGEIASFRCEVANQSLVIEFKRPRRVAGHKVSTLASGTLKIYYR